MSIQKLKQEILNKTREYYNLYHKKNSYKFTAGTTKIKYAGRIFNERELEYLIDSSLDFWLTYGAYSERFEKELADFLGIKWAFLVNSGSSANLLAFYTLTSPLLKERQIQRGDEIITVAAGFPTTVAPIINMAPSLFL